MTTNQMATRLHAVSAVVTDKTAICSVTGYSISCCPQMDKISVSAGLGIFPTVIIISVNQTATLERQKIFTFSTF